MKQIFFILAVIFLLASCDKDNCTYTLGEREYNLIPYAANDTINATFYGKNDEPTVEKLIVGEGELFVIPNQGAFGKPLLCDGTFDVYKLSIYNIDESLMLDGYIEMTKEGGNFIFNTRINYDKMSYGFGMRPFEPEDSYFDSSYIYLDSKYIDDMTYNEVYILPVESDTLYYSTQTGLIKLIYPDGVIKFEKE